MRTVALSFLFFLVASQAFALQSVDLFGGLQWISSPIYEPASDGGTPTGGPSPILNSYSFSLSFGLGRYFRFAPEIALFGTQYGLVPDFPKVVPVEREYRDAIWFLSALLDLSLWFEVPFAERFRVGIGLGGAFHGRIPITAWGTGWDELDAMIDYLYGDARYLLPFGGLSFMYRPEQFERLEIAVRAKGYLPVFHYWDDEEVAFIDQFMLSLSIGLRIHRLSGRRPPT